MEPWRNENDRGKPKNSEKTQKGKVLLNMIFEGVEKPVWQRQISVTATAVIIEL
jgi:hypothetical protein